MLKCNFLYADSCTTRAEDFREDIIASLLGSNCSSSDKSNNAEEVCVVPSVNGEFNIIVLLRHYAAAWENQEVAIVALTACEEQVTRAFIDKVQIQVAGLFP